MKMSVTTSMTTTIARRMSESLLFIMALILLSFLFCKRSGRPCLYLLLSLLLARKIENVADDSGKKTSRDEERTAQIQFKGDFYNKNYLGITIPITEAPWEGSAPAHRGEEIYLKPVVDNDGLMTLL